MKSNMLLTMLLASSIAFAFAAPAVSAPLIGQAGIAKSEPSSVETVQYRRWHRGYGYHRGGGGGAGALIGGLAAGAIIGGVIAAGQANAAAQRNSSYCAQRYRSYDPASGTYLNNNGRRYPCP